MSANKYYYYYYENLRGALEEVGKEGGWQIKQINIIGGTLGSVHVEAFEETLKVMEVKKKEWPAIRKRHVRRLLEAQDAVLLAHIFVILWGFSKRRLRDN